MPRIAKVDLVQLNNQIDLLDSVNQQVSDLRKLVTNIGAQVTTADPTHAPATTNNLAFSWTGSTGVLSWPAGWIKDKNWNAQTVSTPAPVGSAPAVQHNWSVPAGSVTLAPSSYYWLGWSPSSGTMVASKDASSLHSNPSVHVICQIYTGTSGQTGAAGGGGNNGGSDLSGLAYKLF